MTLTESLEHALTSNSRFIIHYRDRSVIRGYVSLVNGDYYITYNKRSVGRTRIRIDDISVIRYSLSRVKLFERLGR